MSMTENREMTTLAQRRGLAMSSSCFAAELDAHTGDGAPSARTGRLRRRSGEKSTAALFAAVSAKVVASFGWRTGDGAIRLRKL